MTPQSNRARLVSGIISGVDLTDQLIDAKLNYIMLRDRLQNALRKSPDHEDRCLALITELNARIIELEDEIEANFDSMVYGLTKAPKPNSKDEDRPG